MDPQRASLERALGVQYAIGRLLGRGGMGAVYHANEKALERAVAIKILPPDLAGDAESRERFRREARTAARLTHPNIVPLHTFGEVEGMLFFVMGFVRGESLGQRMKREGALDPDEVRRILAELAGALDYAHRQGVVHRDIKPDNVLLDEESGRPMLTDFGVAKAGATGATLTATGLIVGTPHYMSPEQAGGARELDGRSDIYSLGVMGYAMLAGRLPFTGDSVQAVIMQQITQDPAPLAVVAKDVPSELADAVTRCLAKDPSRRWIDGRSLAQALGEGEEDEGDKQSVQSASGGAFTLGVLWTGAAMWATLGLTTQALSGPPAWYAIPLVLGGVPTLGLAALALLERRRGDSWKTIFARFMLQPRGWTFWWPARWRRRGDVWHRLPAPLRRARVIGALIVPSMIIMLTTLGIILDAWYHERIPAVWLTRLMGAAVFLGYGSAAGALVYAMRWGRRHGLDQHDASRVAATPTAHLTFWRRARFAALLLNPSKGPAAGRGAEPRLPDEYARAIADGVQRLNTPMAQTGRDAVAAARHVVDALAVLDREIAMLSRDVSPAEIDSLEKRLAALGDARDDAASRGELRQMLAGQLALLRRLNDQLADATARRTRLTDLLRTLWLQVATVRADAARDAISDSDLSGPVRAVVEEIGAFVHATDTLRADT